MPNPGGLQTLSPLAPLRLSYGDELISRRDGHEIAILGEAYLKDIPAGKFDKARPWVLERSRGVADVMGWRVGGRVSGSKWCNEHCGSGMCRTHYISKFTELLLV